MATPPLTALPTRTRRWAPAALALALVAAVPLLLAALARGQDRRLPPDWFSPEPVEVRIGGSIYASDGPEDRAPSGSPAALKCFDYSDRLKASFEVERNCIVEYPLADGVGLHYRFFMVNLEQWREIDRAVRALVDGFRRPSEVK